jgi:hypothetical protein
MILQRILADGEEKLVAPPVVVAGGEVENNRDEGADVLNCHRLGMKVGKRSSFMKEERLTKLAAVGNLRVLIRRVASHVGVVGVGVGVAGGRALVLGASEGVALADRGGFTLLGGSLGLLEGGRGAR